MTLGEGSSEKHTHARLRSSSTRAVRESAQANAEQADVLGEGGSLHHQAVLHRERSRVGWEILFAKPIDLARVFEVFARYQAYGSKWDLRVVNFRAWGRPSLGGACLLFEGWSAKELEGSREHRGNAVHRARAILELFEDVSQFIKLLEQFFIDVTAFFEFSFDGLCLKRMADVALVDAFELLSKGDNIFVVNSLAQSLV